MEIVNKQAKAKISLQGAHIYEYVRSGEKDLLWMSEENSFEKEKAIRGGIPICWPSFGMNNPNLPQHGFARTTEFMHIATQEIDEDTTQVLLRLVDKASTRALWNYKFELDVIFTISKSLKIELKTTNLDNKSFTITQAFHTYFAISDIENIEIFGLEEKPYFDALKKDIFMQNGSIKITKEFDNVYQEVDKTLLLQDKETTHKINAKGSSSTVVWNPWVEKCKRMSLMKENAYREFVCIETANAFEDFKLIKPQETHSLSVEIL